MSLSSYLCNNNVGLALPVPKIEIVNFGPSFPQGLNPNGANYFVASSDTPPVTNKIATHSMPLFIAEQIPSEFYSLDLRLEVLHYTKRSRSKTTLSSRGFHKPTHGTASTSASPAAWPVSEQFYAHPCGNLAPMVPRNFNSRFSGGVDSNWGFVSEYGIQQETQRFLLDGMGSFFKRFPVKYFDGTAVNSLYLFVPRGRLGVQNFPTILTGTSRILSCGYFVFRLSVANPKNPRERIVGPTTNVMSIGYNKWPLVRDFQLTVRQNRTVVRLAPGSQFFNCWWNSRVPGV